MDPRALVGLYSGKTLTSFLQHLPVPRMWSAPPGAVARNSVSCSPRRLSYLR